MVFNGVKNYYEILDVSTDANSQEIKSAYRKLARKYHPDVNKSPQAVDIFKEVTAAYEILSDEKKRQEYDILNGIFKKVKSETAAQEAPQPKKESYNQDRTEYKKENKSYETKEKTSTFKEQSVKKEQKKSNRKTSVLKFIKYWLAKFKKTKKERDNKKPQKGENISTEVIITPDEVISGSKRIINIRTTKTCPKCFGHRFANGDKCSQCGGKGVVAESKKITITIPKGVKDGAKLRIRGEGASGKNGGPNGDIYVIIRIETKTKVHFDKLNIYYNVPITPFEAALGEEITVPVCDGTIKLKLPPNTCSGQKFRIAKQGIKKNGKVGDLIVTVSIEFSHNLSEDEIKLYEQLKNISTDNVREKFNYGS